MNWLQELSNALTGSLLLAMRDPGGFRFFNETEAGFWRSFSALVVVAPLYLYAASFDSSAASEAAEIGQTAERSSMVGRLLGLLVQWAAWPLLMAVIARYVGLSHRYARYIIAYNWSSILVMLVLLPPLVLLQLGIVGMSGATALSLGALVLSLYYRWYVALTALETTGIIASALVLADLVLSLGIARLFG